MSRFIYLITEGVHDVAFLGRILRHHFNAHRVERLSDLDEPRRLWLGGFKWPVKDNIARLGVPAPLVYRLNDRDLFVALRNAEGISRIVGILEDDLDFFSRSDANPDALGVVLDSDKQPQEQRYARLRTQLEAFKVPGLNLLLPEVLAAVGAGVPPVGVFALPEPGKEGTLEDVLLALGATAYPELTDIATTYASAWQGRVKDDAHNEWNELKAQAGLKKATFAAVTALLKPGRGAVATIEDNRWISHSTSAHASLTPCLAFIEALLASVAATP